MTVTEAILIIISTYSNTSTIWLIGVLMEVAYGMVIGVGVGVGVGVWVDAIDGGK